MDFGDLDPTIESLGAAKIPSPIFNEKISAQAQYFISDDDLISISVSPGEINRIISEGRPLPAFELAGPRRDIYFDPSKLRCAIATCGGLCPGLNDIIRAIVLELYYHYGVITASKTFTAFVTGFRVLFQTTAMTSWILPLQQSPTS